MLYSSWCGISVEDVRDEIALSISISGCPLRCKGCHSTETYDPKFGEPLTEERLLQLIKKHKHITCVNFYGGEWRDWDLVPLLHLIKKQGLKTCLYTGYELSFINRHILNELDYIKVGAYKKELGGLNEPNTNQRFINLREIREKDLSIKVVIS